MGCILLRADQNGFDIRIQDTIIKRTDRDTGITEDHFHILGLQAFDYGIRSYHMENPPFLFVNVFLYSITRHLNNSTFLGIPVKKNQSD